MAYKEMKLKDKNEAVGFLSALGADNARTTKKTPAKKSAEKKSAAPAKKAPAKKSGK